MKKIREERSTRKHPLLWWKFKWIILVLCIMTLVFFLPSFTKGLKRAFTHAAKSTIKVVSKTVGEEMKTDPQGNVNIALAGYGGGGHHGGYLADTIMVISWNPKKDTISLISIPRDLYVKNTLGGSSRVNSVFSQLYGRHKDLKEAGSWFAKEIEKIVGLEIPYFATIDFNGFKTVIDMLGGVNVDVPETLHDKLYPDNNLGYETLYVEKGIQHMDGELALKYARSRHSTSDFSRSLRQQQIISAIKEKILSLNMISLSKVKELYAQYIDMVNTNISLNEIIGSIQHIDHLKFYFFWINTYCNYNSVVHTSKGCFLYSPERSLFNGASVMIPFGATATNLSNYKSIHEYVDFITHHQDFLLEDAKIAIVNGIEKKLLREKGLSAVSFAGRLGMKMKRFGMEVLTAINGEEAEESYLLITTENSDPKGYEETIKAIQLFVPIQEVKYQTGVVKKMVDDYGNEVDYFTWFDVQVVLGNDYIQKDWYKDFKTEYLFS